MIERLTNLSFGQGLLLFAILATAIAGVAFYFRRKHRRIWKSEKIIVRIAGDPEAAASAASEAPSVPRER